MCLTYIIAIIHKGYGAHIKPANVCLILTPSSVSGDGLSSGTEVGKLARRGYSGWNTVANDVDRMLYKMDTGHTVDIAH